MALTISDVETEIIDAIATGFEDDELAGLVKTIAGYHGELEDIVREVAQLIIPLPAVLVLYTGSQFSEPANRSYDDSMSFTIVAACKDLRGREGLKAAMYPLLEALKTVLIDNTLDLDIEPLKPKSIEAVAVTKTYSIYAFDVETSFSMD